MKTGSADTRVVGPKSGAPLLAGLSRVAIAADWVAQSPHAKVPDRLKLRAMQGHVLTYCMRLHKKNIIVSVGVK